MTRPGAQPDVDPLAIVRACLTSSAAVAAELDRIPPTGGSDGLDGAGDRVLRTVRPPYPMIKLDLVGDDLLDLRWRSVASVQIGVWGDTDDTVDEVDLRKLLLTCLLAVKTLENKPYGSGDPVVTHVATGSPGQALRDPDTKQLYHVGTVSLTLHPPVSVEG